MKNLGWTSLKSFPECSFKGSDTRLILSFLLDYMGQESISLDAVGTEAFIAAKGIDDFLRLVFSKDNKKCKKSLWSKDEAISAVSNVGSVFTRFLQVCGPMPCFEIVFLQYHAKISLSLSCGRGAFSTNQQC